MKTTRTLLLAGLAVLTAGAWAAAAEVEVVDTANGAHAHEAAPEFEPVQVAQADQQGVWWGNRAVSYRNYIPFEKVDAHCDGICTYCTPDMVCCETGCLCVSCQYICDDCDDCTPGLWDKIFFDLDKSDIRPDAIPELEKILAFLRQNPAETVLVEGHTCDLASDAYNMALGQRRANAVKNWLTARGIAPNRIETVTHGERRPWQPIPVRHLNRRAIVVAEGVYRP